MQSRRAIRAKRVQTAQHVFAAVFLISSGVQHLHHNSVLAVSQIAAGALLIGAVILEKIRHGHEQRAGVAWVEFAGGVLTFIEAVHKLGTPHKPLFHVLTFIPPVILFAFALLDTQISQRRYIRIDDDGVELRVRPFFSANRVPWDAVKGFRVREHAIDFGGAQISLRDVVDRETATAWVVEMLRRRGIEELPA